MTEFRFFCPQCGQHIQCDISYAGKPIDCPICKQGIVVPQPPRAVSAVQPPVRAKLRTWKNVLLIFAAVLVLAGLIVGGRYGYSKIKMRKMPPGLVARWSGDGNVNDSVGGNNGQLVKNVGYAPGKVGQALDFDGASFVQVPDAPDQHFKDAMTVAAWINLRTFNGANSREIVSKIGGPNLRQSSFTLAVDPSKQKAYFVVATTYPDSGQVFSSTTIPLNQWVHLAGTYDGSTIKIFVDGQLDGSTSWNKPLFSGNNPMVIGCTLQNYSYPTSFFNGLIDEIGLYNRALSAAEIQAVYANQK